MLHTLVEPDTETSCVLFPVSIDPDTQTLRVALDDETAEMPVITFQGPRHWAFSSGTNLTCEKCSSEGNNQSTSDGVTYLWIAADPKVTAEDGTKWRTRCNVHVSSRHGAVSFITSISRRPTDTQCYNKSAEALENTPGRMISSCRDGSPTFSRRVILPSPTIVGGLSLGEFVIDGDFSGAAVLDVKAAIKSLNLGHLAEQMVDPSETQTSIDSNAELRSVRELLTSGFSVGCEFPVSQHDDGRLYVDHDIHPEPRFVVYDNGRNEEQQTA